MKEDLNILVVDDDEFIRLSLRVLLEPYYRKIICLSSPQEIPGALNAEVIDVALLDMNFTAGETSCKEGLFWLKQIRKKSPETNVILITAYSEIAVAVDAIKLGAMDFVVKPWENGKILATIHAAVKLTKSQKTLHFLKDRQQTLNRAADSSFGNMIGRSGAMQKIFITIEKVAPTEANILILGENGTGKELVARAIHQNSKRKQEVFVTVDMSAIPEALFESELFGHVKGAFTDAREDRIGRFEAASEGTLFLDEIGNLTLPMQAKILSVLQNRTLYRVGGNKPVPIDVRVISATNQPLRQMVQDNTFRQDLLYRINTVEIELPPLSARAEDIPLLVNHFLEIYIRKYNKPNLRISGDLEEGLRAHHWPGNIRELQHAVERAVILCDCNELTLRDFNFSPCDEKQAAAIVGFDLEHLEKTTIINCITKHRGNISKAAPELGLTRGALYRRLEKYGL